LIFEYPTIHQWLARKIGRKRKKVEEKQKAVKKPLYKTMIYNKPNN
jgi:hypothetical protein